MRDTQLYPNGRITQYFTNTRDNTKQKHAPYLLNIYNNDNKNNTSTETPTTTSTNQ